MPARFGAAIDGLRARVANLEEKARSGDAEAAIKLAKYRGRLENALAADVAFQVELTGDGGGTFTLSVRGGAMSCSSGPAERPLLALRQSVDDSRASVYMRSLPGNCETRSERTG